MKEGKSPLKSKTLWANIIGVAAMLAQGYTGFVIDPAAQAAVLGVVNLVLRAVTKEPIDWGKAGIPGSGTVGVLLIAGALSLLPLLSGCGALNLVEEKPVLTEMAVRVAAARVLEEHPSWTDKAREITGEAIRHLDETEQVDLALLEQAVLDEIPWKKLLPEERELVMVLIRAVRLEIEEQLVEQGITAPEDVKVRVATVLGWIYQVADARLQRSAATAPAVLTTSAVGALGRAGVACEAEGGSRATQYRDREWPDFSLGEAQIIAIIDRAAARADSALGL